MEETISLKDLMMTLKKRLILIISIIFGAILISSVVSFFFLTPVYNAQTQLLINQAKSADQSIYQNNQVQTNLQLINTYNVIIKSPAILDLVIKELDLDMSVGELNEKLTVVKEKDSQVVNLIVEDTNQERAAAIANKTADVFKTEIVKIMSVNNVSVLAKANAEDNPSPANPQPFLIIAIAAFVALLVGVGLSFLLEYLDNTVKNEQQIEKIVGLPILGVIPEIDELQIKEGKKKVSEQSQKLRGETVGS